MHPIERLRFVARASNVPPDLLAAEAGSALMMFADDPPALVSASRRVLARQTSCGPLWWICAHMLTADKVAAVTRECIGRLESDTTGAAGSLALSEFETDSMAPPGTVLPEDSETLQDSDAVQDSEAAKTESEHEPPTVALIDASAIGDGGAIVDATRWDDFDHEASQRWLIGGVGVSLHPKLWSPLITHWTDSDGAAKRSEELVSLNSFTHVVGPSGPVPIDLLSESDCPVAPELFRLAG